MWNKTEHHFGHHISGEQVKAKFFYLGDKQIKGVSTTCGCTVAKTDKKAIKVEMKITLPEYEDRELYYEKDILVEFHDGTHDILKLKAFYKR